MKSRLRDDDPNGDGAKQRSILQRKGYQILIIASMIIGPTGITGLMNAMTDPNIKIENRVDDVEIKDTSQDLQISGLRSDIKQREMRVENYIKSHSEQEALRRQLIEKEFEHMFIILEEIKKDVKDIKNGP